jgi:chorismate dehydratase
MTHTRMTSSLISTRVGRIPYINCYPVYGAIDRGIVALEAELANGVPTELNALMANGDLDVSVVSAVEYARDSQRYLLLPDLAISCDGPVRSVMLFSDKPAQELTGCKVAVSRSSMTSVYLLKLLFEQVWKSKPVFVSEGDSERYDARLVIGDDALVLSAQKQQHTYDLGEEWKKWTGLPFVFAVWVAQRTTPVQESLRVHASLIQSRDWGLKNIPELANQAAANTGVSEKDCLDYLSGLDYGLSYPHLSGLTEFFKRLAERGAVTHPALTFLTAA